MICSLTPTYLSPKTVRVIKWMITIVYTGVMIAMCIWGMVTFPGFQSSNSTELLEWYSGFWETITNAFWLSISFSSTAVTIFAIFKIFGITKELEKYNNNVKINKRSMTLHVVLLCLQSTISIIIALIPYIITLFKSRNLVYIILTVVDVTVQLLICFICLTMNSNAQLRKLKITVVFNEGLPKIIFNRIEI